MFFTEKKNEKMDLATLARHNTSIMIINKLRNNKMKILSTSTL